MSPPRLLILTTVHNPDDTRIRERLIRTLAPLGSITYAARSPGPSDPEGLQWLALPGGRLRRNLAAARHLLGTSWDLVVLHDPETIPAGLLARLLRRNTVVFDVHEDLAAQIPYKSWVPSWARPVFRFVARALYWLAERGLTITLAEPGYQRLFSKPHPVFPNYPLSTSFPEPTSEGDGSAVYVGDVTRVRGIEDAVAACVAAGVELVLVGRVEPSLLPALAGAEPAPSITGHLPYPEALEHMARASVGLSPLRDVPNYRHSLATKTLEYLAVGVPVVATDLPGARAVLGDLGAVWLVPAGHVEEMAKAIGEACDPRAKTVAVKQAAAIRERFRWPEGEVRSFYAGLMEGQSPDPN